MGPELTKVFKNIVGKGHVRFENIENLNDEDRTYLHSIAKASNLLEKIDIPPPKRGETDELINKYTVMKGQILAGNDNKKMVQEFKESILRLSELKLMPKSQVREILIDLTSMIHGSNKSENQKEKTIFVPPVYTLAPGLDTRH